VSPSPSFRFFLSTDSNVLTPASRRWKSSLPANRYDALEKTATTPVAYGHYFQAIRAFLEKDGFLALTTGAAKLTGRPVDAGQIRDIGIFLMKHGAFYHPSRVVVQTREQPLVFVVNVAISAPGASCLQREYNLLQRLAAEMPCGAIPEVYGCGQGDTGQGRSLEMFIGQWFEGFHEFHLSIDASDDRCKVVVWRPEGPIYLDNAQAADIYRQAAAVLARYYDPVSFSQIFPWHHAAGDFVVRFREPGLDVRLVTVRDFGPMFASGASDAPRWFLEALLLFFLNLTLRMRLDRLDGISDLVWADEWVLLAAIEGFFQGLERSCKLRGLPVELLDAFRSHVCFCTKRQLETLCQAIVDRYPSQEQQVSGRGLQTHVAAIDRWFQASAQMTRVGVLPTT
jgi:hypothetical protein